HRAAYALPEPEAVNDGDFAAAAGQSARADQDRRQQARRALSVADQDVAGGEGGIGDYPMEWILPLLAGLGIGSLLKSMADHFMARRASTSDRWYQEKRESYLGLLQALHDAAIHPSDKNSMAFALWQTR